jgi:hypothetical protein
MCYLKRLLAPLVIVVFIVIAAVFIIGSGLNWMITGEPLIVHVTFPDARP